MCLGARVRERRYFNFKERKIVPAKYLAIIRERQKFSPEKSLSFRKLQKFYPQKKKKSIKKQLFLSAIEI